MLIEVMGENLIIDELKHREKDEIINEIASKFKEAGVIKDETKFIEEVKAREQIESTAIGGGIAIPHARSDTVEKLTVAFAKSKEGIDFDSLDGKPVHLIFMIAAPPDVKKGYLQILARIARLCKNERMKEALIKAQNKHEILGIIKGFDIGSEKPERIRLKEGRTIYPAPE
ncbi:MAG: PTS sugar transporter subunit IIA [Caldiserica bacterium]|nr:PTS sugar transporter subunit IIA [Caldisericota bacterium]